MLKIIKIVGLNSDIDAALALVSQEPNIGLFLIIQASLDDAFSRIRQALAEAENLFFSSSSSPSGRLSEAKEGIKKSLAEAENLQILIASTFEDEQGTVLYLICQGNLLQAFILKDSRQTNLAGMSEGELVSGVLGADDRLVMATQGLVDLLGEDFIRLSRLPIEFLEEEITACLPEAQVCPAALIVLEKEKVEEAPAEILEMDASQKLRKGITLVLTKLLPCFKKGFLPFSLLAVVVILIGLGLIYKSKKDQASQTAFETGLRIAWDEFNKAQTLKDSDLSQAAKSLNQAKGEFTKVLKLKPQDSKVLELKKQIEENSDSILKIFSVNDFPLWLDLDLIKKGLTSQKLSLSLGKVLILDEKTQTLVLIETKSKAQEVIAGGEKLADGRVASLNGNIAWVLSEKGLIKVDTISNQLSLVIKKDKGWGEVIDIYGFASNVYLLDKGHPSMNSGQIWKYLPAATGYSDKREYLKNEVKANFSDAKRMQIDSSVWVLNLGGEILKYTYGAPDFFSFSGLDKGVKEPRSFFVSDETDHLYLLDSGNSRLLVLDKKGIYRAQYQSDKFKSFSDLVVDEKEKRIYLLERNKIFVMELK